MSSIEDRAKKAKDVSNEEWEKMKSMISDQLDNVTSSLNELRENGSLDTISQMIKRGDTCPSARLQAWYVCARKMRLLSSFITFSQSLCSRPEPAGIMQCSR